MPTTTPARPAPGASAPAPGRRRSTAGLAKRLFLSGALLGLVISLVAAGTWAAFSSTTANEGNTFQTGTVELTNDRGLSAMFAVSGMSPPQTETGCIEVTYTGTLPATVRLYGTTDAGGLDAYLDLTVEKGATCAAFGTPEVLYTGATLAAYPDSYAAGI